jgi:DNA-binding transcriptional regulator YhcF (GntR family)
MAARSPTGLEVRAAPTHAELANRIGTHREAVTREMRALVTQNIIKTGRRKIQFLDIARLQTSVGRLSLQAEHAVRTAEA